MNQLKSVLLNSLKSSDPFLKTTKNQYSLSSLVDTKIFNHNFVSEDKIQTIKNLLYGIINDKRLVALDPSNPNFSQLQQIERNIPDDFKGIIVFTSGSGGVPKAQALSYQALYYSALGSVEHYQISEEDNLALSLPLNHVGGILIILRALIAKASLSLLNNSSYFEDLFELRPSIISMVSTQLRRLIQRDKDSIAKDFLRGIILGGAPTGKELLAKAISHSLKLSNSYGATEVCAQALATPFTQDLDILQTVGRPLKYRMIQLNENSEILITGNVLRSYTSEKEQDPTVFNSKDLAKVDSKGNYTILGRSDHIFNSGGELINPHEIESCIEQIFPNINTMICEAKHPEFDLSPIAYIETKDFLNQFEFKEKLKSKLENFKIPKALIQSHSLSYLQKGIKLNRATAKSFAPHIGNFKKSYFGNPNNAPLVLLHGFMGQKEDWLDLMKELSKTYFCICLDLPGHGEDNNLNYNSFDDFITKLKFDLNQSFENYTILGYSQGGRIAVGLYHDNPKAKKLIIESANLGLGSEDREKRKLVEEKFLQNVETQNDLETYLKNWYEMPIFKNISNSHNFNSLLNKSPCKIKLWKESLKLLSLSNQRDYWKENLDYSKVYVIHGEQDLKYKEISKKIEKLGAKRIEIKNASHNTHFMNKEDFIRALSACLKD